MTTTKIFTLLFLFVVLAQTSNANENANKPTQNYDEHSDHMIEFTPDDGKRETRLHIVRESDVKDWQKQKWQEEKKFYQQWAKRGQKIVSSIWQPDGQQQRQLASLGVRLEPGQWPVVGVVAEVKAPVINLQNTQGLLPEIRYVPKKPWSRNLMAKLRLKGQLLAAKKGLMLKPHIANARQHSMQQAAFNSRSIKARHDFQNQLSAMRQVVPTKGRQPAAATPVPTIKPWGDSRWKNWLKKMESFWPNWK